jgi:hypothetical protein
MGIVYRITMQELIHTWFDCAANGTINTGSAMAEMGPDLVNRNKIYVTFKCKQANET